MLQSHRKQIQDLALLHARGLLGHAYAFFGAPNIGKSSAARYLAAYMETGVWTDDPNVEPQRPLMDMQVFSPDSKGVIGIDTARSIKEFLLEKPFVSSRRMAIVDRANLMTSQAQNALLKVAEEPSGSALLILVLPDVEILWPTLRSRFQKIYFPPPPMRVMSEKLKNSVDPLAKKFLEISASSRKDFIKELTAPEDFNFTAFLDALIICLAVEEAEKPAGNKGNTAKPKNSKLWHAVLELRRTQDATSLSPRIQLTNLWTLI